MLNGSGKGKTALLQAAAILSIAIALGIVTNILRNDGIAVIGDWSTEARLTPSSGGRMMISLAEAEKMFADKTAVFIDARSTQEFEAGRIQGAVSLPWHGVEQHFMGIAERIPQDRLILTYCDGESCALSKDLALFLKEMGYGKVRVLVNGWSLWKGAGLPVESG